jgi:phenylalanine ammonia-lyase
VNTGFGGSADTRTKDVKGLQQALVQHQNSGILVGLGLEKSAQPESYEGLDHRDSAMPTPWVRGLMLARLNSLVRGHSAVSLPVLDGIVSLINNHLTPITPLRGSVSASGDLIPLSYVAGALQGNSDIYVRTGKDNGYRIMSSDEALRAAEIAPVVLDAKEGLGLLNGTAASVSVASLAMYEANHLALLSQALTAMGCEALRGTADSFHPFISKARPHRGQAEAAANILGFLAGSKLAQDLVERKERNWAGLCQDRYPLRTSPQWIGPQLEDLSLATEQVVVELNSTTDNPLIDAAADVIHHGGNFQAASITSAMEKTRLSIQMLMKMLFAQATEIMNPDLNRGLPPNLCADDPSLSFTCKGIDISLAGYYSELAFLSNPVSTHVQSAEMHNQAINSLALISARYTMQAVEIASMMCAAYIVMACQALDLRVLQMRFVETARPKVAEMTTGICERFLRGTEAAAADNPEKTDAIWSTIVSAWDQGTRLDLAERSDKAAEAAATALMTELAKAHQTQLQGSAFDLFTAINTWKGYLSFVLKSTYETCRQEMFNRHVEITPQFLGQAASKIYGFVRRDLKISFHRGLVEDPTYVLKTGETSSLPASERKAFGTWISAVYEAIRDGQLHGPLMAAVREAME